MKDKILSPESFGFSEEERQLAADLRAMCESGVENVETRERLKLWAMEEEKKIPPPEGSIALDRKRARMFEAAGMFQSAWDSLNAAREQAGQIGDDALVVEIEGDMDAFEERNNRNARY